MNISRVNYGMDNEYLTARSLGLAGAGVAGDDAYASVLINPALAVYSESWLNLNTGISIYKLEEDRSYPYYDNFGGFVDYGSYVFNKYWYSQFYGVITSRLPFDNLMGLSVSTGFIPFKSFDYDYLEEVRTKAYEDPLVAYNHLTSEGVLNAIPFNIAFTPYQGKLFDTKINLAVGAGVNVLSGSIEQLNKVTVKDSTIYAYEITDLQDIDNMPVIPSFGLKLNVGDRFSVGTALRLAYDIDFKNKVIMSDAHSDTIIHSKQTLSYPMRLSFGTEYRFQNILEARIFTDFIYTFWEDFEDSENEDLSFDNTYNIRAGIEHIFFNKMPFRVGFDYGTLRESKDYSQALLSAGTGFILNNIQVDMAVGISSLTYKQMDMFDNAKYGMESSSDADQVQWNHLYARIDVNYAF
ncbi:MAG TPA: hypothetical protein ENO18_05025 [Caldithrix sp.]|nr:hypothetical protein [Caldithrix sp.]